MPFVRSYIKDRGGCQGGWHCFNDTVVEDFDDKDIGSACFGGTDVLLHPGGEPRTECVPRMHNAYMLFYERVEAHASPPPGPAEVPQGIVERVRAENLSFVRDQSIFDQSYFTFVHHLVGRSVANGVMAVSPDLRGVVLELSVRFAVDVLGHSWATSQIPDWLAVARSLLTDDEEGLARCRWLLKEFCVDVPIDREGGSGGVLTSHWLR